MNKKGFTLVELLIVITIIGILAAALLPSILGAPAKSRDAAREAGINSVVTAIESYVGEGHAYPGVKGDFKCLNDFATLPVADGYFDISDYFQGGQIPQDPSGTKITSANNCTSYAYKRLDGSPANYAIVIQMENKDKNNAKVAPIAVTALKSTDAYNLVVDACKLNDPVDCDSYTKSF